MVSTFTLQEKYNQVRRNFCFYLDIQDNGVSRTLSKRIEDLGLQQEVFLTERVTHVVRDCGAPPPARWLPRDGARSRADAMLQRVRKDPEPRQPTVTHNYSTLNVQKAIILLDKIYDTFFTAPRKANVRVFKKHYIKIEFLDKVCRPVYKEFDEWPEIPLDPDPPKDKKLESSKQDINQNLQNTPAGQKMTRKSRPRIKEKEEKEAKGGYCEICNAEYLDAALHRRSPRHLAFLRDQTNFLALDELIDASADVSSFLDKAAAPVNGERRSLRKVCNGDADSPKNNNKRSKRSQSPDSAVNGHASPRRNGQLDDERRHNTRCSKRISDQAEDRQYYKVVGVSTKLRSSGGFSARRRDEPPAVNGAKPLVVKFKKIRKSELSVLSDEAEQFMFPKRASSSSSSSSDDEERPGRRAASPAPPAPAPERRRLARPLALKEESSEEDSWPEDTGRRKRRVPAARRPRRVSVPAPPAPAPPPPDPAPPSPLREEPPERCMRWEGGRLRYTPAVEQLQFAFESVPHSEPWFETFKRQDEDKVVAKNVPHYFSLYATKAPKLPYEIGQLPPLKPNCCPLSALVKTEERCGARYGTRGGTRGAREAGGAGGAGPVAAAQAQDAHPRKSPREHASTLAMLGAAGLLRRGRNDDCKSTASEDTSDSHSQPRPAPAAQDASERLQQFLSEVFDDAEEYDVSEEVMESETVVTTSTNVPDVLSLVSECEGCEIIRDEIREGAAAAARPKGRRGKFKKKNRTGWPAKKKVKKESSGANSPERRDESSAEGSCAAASSRGSDDDEPAPLDRPDSSRDSHAADADESHAKTEDEDSDDKPLKLDVKVLVQEDEKKTGEEEEKQASEGEGEERARGRRKRAALEGLLLMPVVRVARVDPAAARRLRSAARPRPRPARLR
ncbi:hypothetical protein JYU34_005569 [Plutella xylostella]|uniref:DBF4-type domain-containing protein n=2 Tax=Plutella xylostella TaxID=51655 RepID=A0ABQ7QTJ3_PLUXY|nr:hypothetical protein JYU34_005569 [Plutella xylostella]